MRAQFIIIFNHTNWLGYLSYWALEVPVLNAESRVFFITATRFHQEIENLGVKSQNCCNLEPIQKSNSKI